MTEPFDPARYALDDDELDRLLAGATDPLDVDIDRNPVASFLTEARRTTFAAQPRPSDGLVELFARAPSGRPAAPPPINALTLVDRSPTGDGAGRPVAGRPAPGRLTVDSSGAPAANGAGAAVTDSLTVGRPGAERIVSAPTQVYRPSMLDAIVQSLRPTTTKVLMGLSLLLLLLIAGQAVGVIGLPSGDGAQNVAGIDTSLASSTTVDVTEPAPTVQTSDTAAPTTSLTTAPTIATTTPTIATTTPTIATTTPTIATTAPTAPTSSTTTPTIATSATTATTVATTTVVETSITASTVPTSATLTVIEQTTTTEGPVVVLVPGVTAAVPDDVPPGSYRATVDNPLGCTVVVVNADGGQATHQAGSGSEIAFQLIVGSQVVTSGGCPQVFRPTVG